MTEGMLEVTVGNRASPHTKKVWPFEPDPGVTSIHVESHPQGGARGWVQTITEVQQARKAIRRARRADRPVFVLAHGAGRAGLLARWLIDPHPFVIIYGSEVVEAAGRPWVSRWLTVRTVEDASGLAVATKAMLPAIESLVPGAGEKTRIVGMPVDWDTFCAGIVRRGEATLRILSVRRMLPLYHITDVVEAAAGLREARLSLMRGAVPDTEPYVERVQEAVRRFRPDAEVLDEFFDVAGLVDQYSRTDIAVSVPEHDQMSVGMLEALGAGCVAVLSDLPSYGFLHGLEHVFWVQVPEDVVQLRDALTQAMAHVRGSDSVGDRRLRAESVRAAYEAAHETR